MQNPLDFTGKTVLVVGGSSGIGNATAQAYRAAGAKVYVWGTRPSAEDYHGQDGSDLTGLEYMQINVVDFDALESLKLPFDGLDVAVLSQGLVLYGKQEYTMAGFRKVVDVNLNGLMACALKLREPLKTQKGSLIVISSVAAFHATPGNPAYNASKTGAYGLTRTLALAWARDEIRVNGVAPGFVPTKMTSITTDNKDNSKAAKARIPIRRFGKPEEIAAISLFLSSPMAGYIVGQTLIADGGMTL